MLKNLFFYRRPPRFADYLTWECFGRPMAFGLVALGGFLLTLTISYTLAVAGAFVAMLGVAAGLVDGASRHPRFSRDFRLIRALEGWHRQNDFAGLVRAELLVWNGQYVLNFLVGFTGVLLVLDALLPTGLSVAAGLQSMLLFSATFFLTNGLFWRFAAYGRVMAFLKQLKVDYREQISGG